MTIDPLVSIIIPVYNSERYIVDCVNSIKNQTYKNLEILLCDDASSDNSYQLLSDLEKNECRIKLFSNEENQGISKTQNILLDQCLGEYIAIMNSDDIAKLDRIEKQVSYLSDNTQVDILGGNIEILYEEKLTTNHFKDLKLTNQDILKQLTYATAIDHITLMVRKNVFSKIRYNELLPAAIDLDLLLQAKTMNFNFSNLNEVLCTYRIHDESVGSKNRTKQLKGAYYAHKLYSERKKFGVERTKLSSVDFENYESFFEELFLKLSSIKREDTFFTSILRLLVSPFSEIGRYCLTRNILKRISG